MQKYEIASNIVLPKNVAKSVQAHLAKQDEIVVRNLSRSAQYGARAEFLAHISALLPLCAGSAELANTLSDKGLNARPLINCKAFEVQTSFDLFTSTGGKDHLVCAVDIEGDTLYIDTSWMQFMCDLGLSLGDIDKYPELQLAHKERAICYKDDELEDVVEWFVTTVRFLQDYAKSAQFLYKTDMYTRQITPLDIFMRSKDLELPVNYLSIQELREIARRIWDPKHFILYVEDQ